MKVLIITDLLPYPLVTGGQQAQFHIIDYLRKDIAFSIIFRISNLQQEAEYKELEGKWSNVILLPYYCIPIVEKETLLFKSLLKIYNVFFKKKKRVIEEAIPYSLHEKSGIFINQEFIEFVNEKIETDSFDIIQTDFYPMLECIYFLPQSIKKIFIQHEIRYIRNELTLKTSYKNVFYDFLWLQKKTEEITAMNLYDTVITLTEIDRLKLLENGVNVPVFASPAAIKPTTIANGTYQFENKIVFMGSAYHTPNYDAVVWFLQNVWSRLDSKSLNMTFSIIGDWTTEKKSIEENGYDNVNFMGFVPDLEDALRGSIMVVPIRIGSGMRMKIIDAANYGIPFITTAVGVEGLDFVDGKDCFIEENPIDFANKMIRLVNDKELQLTFIQNARKVMATKYSVETLANRRLEIYKETLSKSI